MQFLEAPFSEFIDNLEKDKYKEAMNNIIEKINIFIQQNSPGLQQVTSKILKKQADMYRVLEYLYSGVCFEIVTSKTWKPGQAIMLNKNKNNTFTIDDKEYKLKMPDIKDENSYHRDTCCEMLDSQVISHSPFSLRLVQKDIPKDVKISCLIKLQQPTNSSNIYVSEFCTLLDEIPVDVRNLLDTREIQFIKQDYEREKVDIKYFDIYDQNHAGLNMPAVPSRITMEKVSKHPEQLSDKYLLDDDRAPEPEQAVFWDTFDKFLAKMDQKTQSLKQMLRERQEKATEQPQETQVLTQEPFATAQETTMFNDAQEMTEVTMGDSRINHCLIFTTPCNPGQRDSYLQALKQFVKDNNLDFDQFDWLVSTIEQLRYRAGQIVSNKGFIDVSTGIDNGVIAIITKELQNQRVLEPALKLFICFVQNFLIGVRWNYLQSIIDTLQQIIAGVKDINQFPYIVNPQNCVFPNMLNKLDNELFWYDTRQGVLELLFSIIGHQYLVNVKSAIERIIKKKQ